MVKGQKRDHKKVEVRLFENVSILQQFLIDRYHETNDTPEFSSHPIKVQFIDIETYSPNEFPTPEKAKDTVNVITIYDSLDKIFYTWGLKPYKSKADNHKYVHCKTERDLLVKFVDFIHKDPPDVLSGWNSEFFDIPYLINRIQKLIGAEFSERLSPVGVLYSRQLMSSFGRESTRWHIKGMSCVDYLDVYKVFSVGLRESYKLNDIAEHELGDKKVDFGNTNLSSLADNDWETFVDYNIQDVNLLVKMEEKLQYLELLRMLAYVGLTPFENAMGTLNVVTGAVVKESRKRGLIIPSFVKDVNANTAKYEGAYVGEPARGFKDHIVSFDVNSLYPNIMISLNLSPETKMGTFDVEGDDVRIQHVNGESYVLSKPKFGKFIKDGNLSISKAKVLFSQSKKGIFPAIVDNFYTQRVKMIKELTKTKRQIAELSQDDPMRHELQDKADKLHIRQFTIKILINRIYGYFGNKHSLMGDADIARSITLTGQSIIKQSNKILETYIKDKCELTDEEIQKDSPIIYNDTDSVYITIKHIVDKFNIPFTTTHGKVTKDIHTQVNDIEKHLNTHIKEWGQAVLNSKDCRFVFKRESISDVGSFLQKKRYVLHILDDEGISVNKFKYTGVEVVRTTMPKPIKPYVKKIIETMLLTKDMNKTNEVFHEAYDKFKALPIEDMAFVMGISKYKTEKKDSYGQVIEKCDNFHTYKGMPIHVKSAYYYNLLLNRLNLTNKYESINSGDKVRYFYVSQPNRFGIKSVAYKYYYPEEFQEFIIPDTEQMFEKIVYSVVERFYEAVGWQCRRPNQIVQTDLFELLQP